MANVLEGWTESRFAHEGMEHAVYRRGSGPGVIVMHEIPGITPPVARFANLVVDAGYTVLLPWMFGEIGRAKTGPYAVKEVAKACVSREFSVLAARGSSPITTWLRALARQLHAELGGRGVGAIGMCLTGNFALAMSVDAAMMAPVLSQPSLPGPFGAERRAGLHVTDEALVTIQARCAKEGLRVLGLRFTKDRSVPDERFAHLKQALGTGFEAFEIDSTPGNAHGIPQNAHSVVTESFVDREGHPTRAAVDRVLAFFGERLRS
jgi:dienelactone hydrolase